MKRIFSALLLAGISNLTLAAPAVKVNIEWNYKDFTDPVIIHEVKGQPPLWHTDSVTNLATAPISEPIAGSSFLLEPGQKKRFALVVKNTTDKPLYFFAAPHMAHPEEASLGFKFKCLCINHAYTIGPKETWYRIVEFRMSPNFVGDELTITHTVIGIDKKRAASFSNEPTMSDM